MEVAGHCSYPYTHAYTHTYSHTHTHTVSMGGRQKQSCMYVWAKSVFSFDV